MATPLNILIAEDSEDDVELIMGELRRAGFNPNWQRVETEAAFMAELQKGPDLILSDFAMPEFSGLRAAQLTQASGRDIPFILISGTIGEDVAVAAMKSGATDYLIKDRIVRLGKAVEQALEQKQLRATQKQVDASLKLFRALIDRSSDGLEVIDPETGRFLDVNETTCERLGYTRTDLLSLSVPDIDVMGASFGSWKKNVEEIRRAGFKIMEGRQKRKDGSTFPVEIHVRCVQLDREYLIAGVRDITERKRAEVEIQNQLQELQRWHELMLGREDRVLELKREVNELLAQLNKPARYLNTSNSTPAAE